MITLKHSFIAAIISLDIASSLRAMDSQQYYRCLAFAQKCNMLIAQLPKEVLSQYQTYQIFELENQLKREAIDYSAHAAAEQRERNRCFLATGEPMLLQEMDAAEISRKIPIIVNYLANPENPEDDKLEVWPLLACIAYKNKLQKEHLITLVSAADG